MWNNIMLVSNPPPHPLVQRFAVLVGRMIFILVAQRTAGRVAGPMLGLLTDRFRTIKCKLADLIARVQAGTYRPRCCGPRRTPASRKPPTKNPDLQKFGWLAALLPDFHAQQSRAMLFGLLQQPEMKALIEAAPGPTARAFRPLCWALKLKPPGFLPAAPRRPRQAALPDTPASDPTAPEAAPPGAAWPLPAPAPTSPGLRKRRPRACGSPKAA